MRSAVIRSLALLTAGVAMIDVSSSLSLAQAGALDQLNGLAWKTRPLVVVADQADDSRFQRQIALLEPRKRALDDYDVKLVTATEDSAALRHRLRLPAVGFVVALVGKDGGVKQTWRAPVDPDRIFALIDTMPMRRDEVRRRKPD
jgi:hypothetical protein